MAVMIHNKRIVLGESVYTDRVLYYAKHLHYDGSVSCSKASTNIHTAKAEIRCMQWQYTARVWKRYANILKCRQQRELSQMDKITSVRRFDGRWSVFVAEHDEDYHGDTVASAIRAALEDGEVA